MLLTAIVREVRPSGLLVRDTSNGQDVFVRTAHAPPVSSGRPLRRSFQRRDDQQPSAADQRHFHPPAGWRRPFSAASPPVAALLRGLGLVSGPFFV